MDTDSTYSGNGGGNKKLLIFGSVILILVIAVVSVLLLSRRSNVQQQAKTGAVTDENGQNPSANEPAKSNVITNATTPPEVSFVSWTGLDKPPGVPTSLSVYSLKQSFTAGEINTLAQKLGANGLAQTKNNIVTSYLVNEDKTASLLVFNNQTGEFSYRASKGVPLPAGEKIEDKSYAFLRSLGWYDPTIQVAATYKNATKPGILYVELHRSWASVNAPIFNPIGLLNVPEAQTLSSLTLNSNLPNTPKDADITSTSDDRNGYLRADDFNTITLGINEKTQSVTMIKSNMRPVTSVNASNTFISYEQAVNKLKNGQYTFIFTSPAGAGDANWTKVYPDNLAQAKRAEVSETIMAYLEQSPSTKQTTLEPYYIFRGKAKLDSGYTVTFNAAVAAATNGPISKDTSLLASVKGIFAQANQGDTTQKQGTFDGGKKTTPTTSNPTNETPIVPGLCQPAASELNPVYQANGLTFGWAPYTYWKTEYRNNKSGYWYYVPDETATASIVESNLDSIIAALEEATPNSDVRDQSKIQYDIQKNIPGQRLSQDTEETTATENTQKQDTFYPTDIPQPTTALNMVFNTIFGATVPCPVRLTGSSPTLFVYGMVGTEIGIRPTASYTYADPAVPATGVWSVEVLGTNNLKASEVTRPYMYYEYEKAAFARPSTGWTVKKSQLQNWVHETLEAGLALTPAEADRALFELKHASADVNSSELFIGFIDQKELSAKLPLTVMGAQVTRIHMYVGASKGTVIAPSLSPLYRPESFVLELGSHAE